MPVDTGLDSNIGPRLMKVRRQVEDDEVFLTNYAGRLTDLPLGVPAAAPPGHSCAPSDLRLERWGRRGARAGFNGSAFAR